MNIKSFNEDLNFGEDKITTKVILESPLSKEVRILMKKGQIMKEHKTPFPIIVHVLEGELDFKVQGIVHELKSGAIISLKGNTSHNLEAKQDCIVRLTLSKLDAAERVEKLASNS